MGGRTTREDRKTPEREAWIAEVSDTRLERYERLMNSASAPYRLDGGARIGGGEYFRDLVRGEIARRKET